MPSMKRRHSLTLIEVLVGFSLFAVLIMALMGTYVSMTHSKMRLKEARNSVRKITTLTYQMQKLLDHAKTIEIKPGAIFPELHLELENYRDPDPHFFGELTAKVSYQNNALLITLTSTSEKTKQRQIFLIEQLSQLSYSGLAYTSGKGSSRIRWSMITRR